MSRKTRARVRPSGDAVASLQMPLEIAIDMAREADASFPGLLDSVLGLRREFGPNIDVRFSRRPGGGFRLVAVERLYPL